MLCYIHALNTCIQHFQICEKNYNSDQQYITTAQCVIIVDIQEYKTLVKKLATIDFEIMDLVKRHQEITHLQSKLIKECKNIDIQLDKKILQKCRFEKAKFAILPSIDMLLTHLHRPNNLQKKQYLIVGNTLENEIIIHNKLVM